MVISLPLVVLLLFLSGKYADPRLQWEMPMLLA